MNWIGALAQVLAEERQNRSPGSVVVLDFLSRDELMQLESPLREALGAQWGVYLVGSAERTPQAIPADRAVDFREDLSLRTWFLVITSEAGAGLQGVYDVAEVVEEQPCLQKVRTVLRRELRAISPDLEAYAWSACREARSRERQGTRTDLFLRREVEFLDATLTRGSMDWAGLELHRLGLIPDPNPRRDTLEANAGAVRELLRTEKNRPATAADRVARLKLTGERTRERLVTYLRDKPIHHLESWLPGLIPEDLTFDHWRRQTDLADLQGIELIAVRQASRRPYKWTGLGQDEDGGLYFSLHEDSPNPRLEIRWQAIPGALPDGAAEYRVTLLPVGGGEPLVEDFLVHKAARNHQQKWQVDREVLAQDVTEATAYVEIAVVGREEGDDKVKAVQTEEFLLTTLQIPEAGGGASGAKITRSVWDAGLEHVLLGRDAEEWYALRKPDCVEIHFESLRRKIPLPTSLYGLESLLLQRDSDLGIYEAKLRPDGCIEENPRQVEHGLLQEDHWATFGQLRGRLFRKFQREADRRCSEDGVPHPLAVETLDLTAYENDIGEYARAYASALKEEGKRLKSPDQAVRDAALTHLELGLRVDSLLLRRPDDSPLGWIVAPTHPLRLLWLLAYGALLTAWRKEVVQHPKGARKPLLSLRELDWLMPHLFPAFTAREDDGLWCYADGVGLYWGILLPVDTADPQQAVADVLRAIGLEAGAALMASLSADLVGAKIGDYVHLHRYIRTLQINALNPGDGNLLKQALIRVREGSGDPEKLHPRFDLRLLPAQPDIVAGRHLDALAAARRRNRALTDKELLLFRSAGSAMTPGLQWAQVRGLEELPEAHLSVMVDYFSGDTTTAGETSPGPPEVYGLSLALQTQYEEREGRCFWRRWVAPSPGAKSLRHPANPAMTDWLSIVHTAILHAAASLTAANGSGGEAPQLPAMGLEVSQETTAKVERIHERCDWVIALDRHLGVEYFDQPHGPLGAIYEKYLLDYVPAAVEGSSHRLMISTQRSEEIRSQLREGLKTLSLKHDEAACRGVLSELKAICGRTALRLNAPEAGFPEVVALTAARHYLHASGQMEKGFLLPGDSLIYSTPGQVCEEPMSCALLLVSLGRKNKKEVVDFEFVEVKYAFDSGFAFGERLRHDAAAHARKTAQQWESDFFPEDRPLDLSLRRRRMVRMLRFYLDKAVRYRLLASEVETSLRRHVGELLDVEFDRLGHFRLRGILVCPTLDRDDIITSELGDVRIDLLGALACPDYLVDHHPVSNADIETIPPSTPEESGGETTDSSSVETVPSNCESTGDDVQKAEEGRSEPASSGTLEEEPRVCLGVNRRRGSEAFFRVSVRGNPHLLVVGIPGMGKTTALVNLATSLARQDVWPLVFDFHGDLASKLRETLDGQPFVHLDAAEGLTFNPLRLSHRQSEKEGGWIDNAFEVTDILSAVYPDFGDLQTAEIRRRIIRSYQEFGFREDAVAPELSPPPFRQFYDQMLQEASPTPRLQHIIARLDNLFQRRLFREGTEETGVDELVAATTVLDLHEVSSEQNQLAAASFFLHKVYKDMFVRGEASRIRQAIIFDEAHRAARLGLLGTMMQECRKFGIMMVVSSQRVSDFRRQVVETVGSYLILKVNPPDAKYLAPMLTGLEGREATQRRLLDLPKYYAVFRSEDFVPYTEIELRALP